MKACFLTCRSFSSSATDQRNALDQKWLTSVGLAPNVVAVSRHFPVHLEVGCLLVPG